MSLSSQREIHVLHVDDEPDFADLTGRFLEREDDRFTVETATSATGGLERINDRPPDCVVSDYNMPGMDGIEFLQAVREEHPDLPFVLFTGKGSEAVASDAIAAGVTDYLQKKPGSEQYELLANRIRNAVHARRETERADRQEQLMRLTEFAGDTGGFELDVDSGDLLLTDGTRRLVGLSDDTHMTLEEAIELYHPDDRADVRQTVTRAAETGEETRGTWRLQTLDGDERLVDVTMVPATENDHVTTLRGAVHDVTERKERERELSRLQQAIDSANVPITLADPSQEDDPLVYVNDGFEEMTGYSPEETLGRNCRFLQGEDTDPETVATLREAIDNEEPVSVELRNYRKDGTEFWNRLTVTPIYDDDDKLVRYLGTQEDVTERKERERELRSERRFVEQALDALEDLFYVICTDGTLRRWNDRVVETTGYADPELADMQAIELFPEDDREAIADAIETTLADGRATVEADLLTATGERRPYEFTGARLTDVDGNTTGLVGIGRDLTERKRREQQFQALVEESNDVISIVDTDGVFQYQSPSVKRILGYEPEETIGDTAWEYVHPDDRADLVEAFERGIADPDANPVAEYRARHADGSWRWLAANGNNQLDNPAVEGYIVNSRDITERKERERELRQLKEEYRSVVENVQDSLFLWEVRGDTTDREFVLRRINSANASLLGVSAENARGKTPAEIFGEETGRQLIANYERSIDRGEPISYEERLNIDGEARHFETTVTPVEVDGEVTQIVGVAHDVTERLERKRELKRQNERLDEFTSIVSHDLRSPLTVAEGQLELAQETGESEHLARAADAVSRSQTLIDDLLTLAREGEQVTGVESVALADVAENSWQTTETGSVTLDTDTTQGIRADRSRLRQLFENLYRNAVEHGGDDVTVCVGAMDDGFYVSDTGPGIPESEREAVFEAGYSTSEAGTGFGLRIVEQIADAHGWEIDVTESDQGGARFEFTGVV